MWFSDKFRPLWIVVVSINVLLVVNKLDLLSHYILISSNTSAVVDLYLIGQYLSNN